MLFRLIPIYLMGYTVMKYLGYHTDWILSGLSEVVGKSVVTPFEPFTHPDPFNRFVLYKFLVRYQGFEPEAWLKNVEGVDVQECLKDNPSM